MNNMKNIIGLEMYRKYLSELDYLKNKVSNNRSEKDEELAYKLVQFEETNKKIKKIEVITYALFFIIAGIVWFILTEMGQTKYFWIYLVIVGIVAIAMEAFKIYIKASKESEINKKKKAYALENEAINEYHQAQEKLFKIVVYIICVNEYLPVLCGMKDDKIEDFWQKITKNQVECINKYNGYAINIEGYQNYFENWLRKQGYYE